MSEVLEPVTRIAHALSELIRDSIVNKRNDFPLLTMVTATVRAPVPLISTGNHTPKPALYTEIPSFLNHWRALPCVPRL